MSALAGIGSQISTVTYDVLLEKIRHYYFKVLSFEGVFYALFLIATLLQYYKNTVTFEIFIAILLR